MIEFILISFVYMVIAGIVSFPLTASVYKARVKKLPRDWKADQFTQEQNLEKELAWRKKQRETSKRDAGWYAILWAIFFPLELIFQIAALFDKGADKALDKEDQDVQTQIALIKAQKILDQREADQRAEFDKLVS